MPASDAGNGERLAAQRLGQPQRVGKPVALLSVNCRLRLVSMLTAVQGAAAGRQPLGVTARARARGSSLRQPDASPAPRGRHSRWLHMSQELFIDALGGSARSASSRTRSDYRRKVMLKRALACFGNVDLASFSR